MKKLFTLLIALMLSFSIASQKTTAASSSIQLKKQPFTVLANKNGSLSYLGYFKDETDYAAFVFVAKGDFRFAYDSSDSLHWVKLTNGRKFSISLGSGTKSVTSGNVNYLLVPALPYSASYKIATFDNKNVSKIPVSNGSISLPSVGDYLNWKKLSLVSESPSIKAKITSISFINTKAIILKGSYTAKTNTVEPSRLLFYHHASKQHQIIKNDTKRSIPKGKTISFEEVFDFPSSFYTYKNEQSLWTFLLGENIFHFDFKTGKQPTTAPLAEYVEFNMGENHPFKRIDYKGLPLPNGSLFYQGYSLLPALKDDVEFPFYGETIFPLGKNASSISFRIAGSPKKPALNQTYQFYVMGDDYKGIDKRTNKPIGKILYQKEISEKTPLTSATIRTKGISTVRFVVTTTVNSDDYEGAKSSLFPILIGNPVMKK